MWYQSNNSFFLDLQLIFMTAWVILFPLQNFMKNGLKIYLNEVFKYKLCHSIQIQQRKQEKNLKEVLQKRRTFHQRKDGNAL